MVFGGIGEFMNVFVVSIPKWISKKEQYANSKWILRNLFCWRSNLSKIISASGRSDDGCGKWLFLVWNRIRIWTTVRHSPTTKNTPRGFKRGIKERRSLYSKGCRHPSTYLVTWAVLVNSIIFIRGYCCSWHYNKVWGINLTWNKPKTDWIEYTR